MHECLRVSVACENVWFELLNYLFMGQSKRVERKKKGCAEKK